MIFSTRQVLLFMMLASLVLGVSWGVASEIDRSLKRIAEYVAAGNKDGRTTKSTNLRFIHRRIIVIGQQGTPEAASALMSIVLDPAVAEYDEMRWFDSHWQIESTLGHTSDGVGYFAARELARFPFTEPPMILSAPSVKVEPEQRRALKAYGAEYPAQMVANCRAWCEEVRDGKRTMKFAGDSREYDFQGKRVTSRASPRRGDRRQGFEEGNPAPDFDADEGEKVSLWMYFISGAVLNGSFGYWWICRRRSTRP